MYKERPWKRYLPGPFPPPFCWPKPSSSATESWRVLKRCLIINLLLEVTTIQFSRVLQRCLRSTHQELGSLKQIWRTCSFTLTKKWDLSNRIHMEHTSTVIKNSSLYLRRSWGTLDWSQKLCALAPLLCSIFVIVKLMLSFNTKSFVSVTYEIMYHFKRL